MIARVCIRNVVIAALVLHTSAFAADKKPIADSKPGLATAFVGQADTNPLWDVPAMPKISAVLRQIDPRGNLAEVKAAYQVKWLYLAKSKRSNYGQPAVQFEVELDKAPPPLKASNALEVRILTGDKPKMVISTDLQTTSLIFAEKEGAEEQSYVLTLEPEYPWAYTDPSCERDGYELETLTNQKGLHLYTGIYCVEEGYTASQIVIFRNPESKILAPDTLRFNQSGSGWARTLVDSEKIPSNTSIALEYSVHHGDSNKKSNYHIRFTPARKFRKFTYSIGTSITQNNYSFKVAFTNSPINVQIKQLDWTQKAALSFKSGPNAKWDFSVSGFVAWMHFTNSFSSQNAISVSGQATATTLTAGDIRYIGGNLRARYSLPWQVPNWKFYISGGFYGVMFKGQSTLYVVTNLQGPQIYPTASRFFKNRASLGFYTKYSPMTDGTKVLDLTSRELAVGSFYLFPSRTHRQWGVSVDYADLLFNGTYATTSGSIPLTVSNTSFSVGGIYSF